MGWERMIGARKTGKVQVVTVHTLFFTCANQTPAIYVLTEDSHAFRIQISTSNSNNYSNKGE